jgi:hypothetical protein
LNALTAALIATVALFGLCFVALRGSPKSATSSGTSSHSLRQYQPDIAAARHAVTVSDASDAASGGGNGAAATATKSASTRPSARPTAKVTVSRAVAGTADRLNVVSHAVK